MLVAVHFNKLQIIKNMKYKIVKGSKLFKSLTDLKAKIDSVNSQAMNLAIELGGVSSATNNRRLAGGIDAVEFKEKPIGWKAVGEKWDNLYYPKSDKANKEIHTKINALPTMDYDELNNMVGFKSQFSSNGRGISHYRCVGMKWSKSVILMETADENKYVPIEGVIEILGSEYDKLSKAIKD